MNIIIYSIVSSTYDLEDRILANIF